MKISRRSLAAALCAICALSSCLKAERGQALFKKKRSPYGGRDEPGVLRYPLSSEPPTLDWSKSSDTTSSLVISNIMEGLARYDFSGGAVGVRPALASSWEASKDNTIWRFRLKKSVFWSDGKPLAVRHFIDSWERLLNPATGSEYSYFLFALKNAKDYSSGKLKDFRKVGARESPSGELVVHLERGLSYFPYLLTHTSTFPIRKDIIESKKSLWTRPENIVTLGPYRLSRWDHEKALILTENEAYHAPLPPAAEKQAVKKAILYIIPEETAVLNLFDSGRLDTAVDLPSRELPFLKKRKEYKSYDILSLYYYGFNARAGPLRRPLVRKALIHAVSRGEIIRLLNGGQSPLKSWIPKGLFGHNPNVGLGFDPKKARRLLKEAGYSGGRSLPKIQLFYNTSADHKMIAENIQAQLKKNLNIDLELNSQEWKTYLQRLKTKDVEIFRLGWQADYPDPNNFMNLMASFSENNHTGWKSAAFDRLILKAMGEPDGPQRKALYDKAQKILLEEDAAVFPIYSGKRHILVSPRIRHYPVNVMSEVLFRNIRLAPD